MDTQRVPEVEETSGSKQKNELTDKRNRGRKKKSKRTGSYLPKFARSRIERDATGDAFDIEVVDASGRRSNPNHLIITVNGLIGSAQNWKFAAKQFLKNYPEDVIVHCSDSNAAMLTFDGIDVMGERLAEEVISVVKRHPGLKKISFVGHSLGGLVARYAIAKLYGRDILTQGNGHAGSDNSDQACYERKHEGKIAGLEPINFITSATPHLGSRGHKQVPMFLGSQTLEKVASRLSWFLGRTGKHLFLTDSDNGKPPILLQMVHDSEHMKFLSALQSFKHRVAYANVRHDQLVGWSTSSIRRRHELPKRQHLSRHEKYPHVVNVETAKSTYEVPAEIKVNGNGNRNGKIDMEEEIIRGLTKMSWDRVDVSFSGRRQRYLAHSTIQVQTYRINSDGADVIQHMIDNFEL